MITIYGKENCTYCTRAKQFAETRGLQYVYKDVGLANYMDELLERAEERPRSVPQIWVDESHVGGYNEFVAYVENTGYTGTGYSL